MGVRDGVKYADHSVIAIPAVVGASATPLQMWHALTSGALRYVTRRLEIARFLGTMDCVPEGADARWHRGREVV